MNRGIEMEKWQKWNSVSVYLRVFGNGLRWIKMEQGNWPGIFTEDHGLMTRLNVYYLK